MVRRTDTRLRMLESAAELFQAQGYHATGLNQLVAASGAPKGSMYFHFPGGKEQLAAEAMQMSAQRLGEALREVAAAAPDPASALGAAVELLGGALAGSDYQRGCPLAPVLLDAAGESEQIRQACEQGYASWRELIAEVLAEHGLSADRADTLATVALAAIEGGLLLAKASHDTAPLRAVAEHLRATIDNEIDNAKEGS